MVFIGNAYFGHIESFGTYTLWNGDVRPDFTAHLNLVNGVYFCYEMPAYTGWYTFVCPD